MLLVQLRLLSLVALVATARGDQLLRGEHRVLRRAWRKQAPLTGKIAPRSRCPGKQVEFDYSLAGSLVKSSKVSVEVFCLGGNGESRDTTNICDAGSCDDLPIEAGTVTLPVIPSAECNVMMKHDYEEKQRRDTVSQMDFLADVSFETLSESDPACGGEGTTTTTTDQPTRPPETTTDQPTRPPETTTDQPTRPPEPPTDVVGEIEVTEQRMFCYGDHATFVYAIDGDLGDGEEVMARLTCYDEDEGMVHEVEACITGEDCDAHPTAGKLTFRLSNHDKWTGDYLAKCVAHLVLLPSGDELGQSSSVGVQAFSDCGGSTKPPPPEDTKPPPPEDTKPPPPDDTPKPPKDTPRPPPEDVVGKIAQWSLDDGPLCPGDVVGFDYKVAGTKSELTVTLLCVSDSEIYDDGTCVPQAGFDRDTGEYKCSGEMSESSFGGAVFFKLGDWAETKVECTATLMQAPDVKLASTSIVVGGDMCSLK